MKVTTISFVLGLGILVWLLPEREVDHAPGVLVAGEPRQGSGRMAAWERKAYRIQPLASYSLQGRILLTDRYWLGRESDLSPLDLTFGWGRLSDSAILAQYSIYRGHRCFHWKPKGSGAPVPAQEVVTHTANVHLIPADERIRESLMRLRKGDVAELGGYLVEVTAADGWRWRSSLTRDDSGPGACELMWVDWVRAI